LIIDDVITAGTAIKEAMEVLQANGAELSGVVVAMDRQEKGTGELSAIQEIEENHQIKVVNIINLQNIIDFLEAASDNLLQQHLVAVTKYRQEFGI
jgi:orotate phosphoribosyltransferase